MKEGSRPSFPTNPDPNQTGVRWVKLTDLKNIILYPNIREHIINYSENKRNIDIIKEHCLEEYV